MREVVVGPDNDVSDSSLVRCSTFRFSHTSTTAPLYLSGAGRVEAIVVDSIMVVIVARLGLSSSERERVQRLW